MSQKIRKLGRTNSAARVAMLRAMVTYLLENGQIKTTVTRAKEVAPLAEKMITLAKDNTLASYRQALAFITKEDVANKLFKEIGPKYADRKGGYTRIVRIGPRRGDAAEMAIIQLVCSESGNRESPPRRGRALCIAAAGNGGCRPQESPLIRPYGPPSPLWGEGFAGG